MKATDEDWENATINLNQRRSNGAISKPSPASDYKLHLTKCGYGESVLDVGCGSQYLKSCLPYGFKYIGLDAFPIEGIDCIHSAIEDLKGWKVDTVCAFAVLDNCRDFDKACQVMKATAQQNIIILTGIGIDVDRFHTFRLEHSDFERNFNDWNCTHKEEIQPKVWLINYSRK